MNAATLYSVGHGDRELAELLDLLRTAGIRALVDVRAEPHSRRHRQFSEGALRAALEEAGIVYHWAGRQLGGRRPPQPASRPIISACRGCAWCTCWRRASGGNTCSAPRHDASQCS